jgi:hypothetical protein
MREKRGGVAPFVFSGFGRGIVSGCSGREEKEVWFLGFLWFFSILQNCPPPFVCVEDQYL